ncbi:MAG: super-infection exclusion protein B [Emcibacteraceae bacterium]
MDILGFFAKLIEKSATTLFIIATCTGFILFGPDEFIARIGINNIQSEYKTFIGFIFLFSSVAVISMWAIKLFEIVVNKIQSNSINRASKQALTNLSSNEKEFLRPYIVENVDSQIAFVANGTVCSLEHKGIILRASEVSSGVLNFPYILQPWARDHLTKNTQLLD